jgi:predicted nucleotidyltransferase component of viral defense system
LIGAEEIRRKSFDESINTSDVQRDYIFSWILAGLYTQSNLANLLVLKGGNVYRKAYFHATRFSNDLDFTTEQGVNPANLMRELNGICEHIAAATGIQFSYDKNGIYDEHFIDDTKSSYKVRLYFKDFLGAESSMVIKVKLDVAQFDKIYLTPVSTRLLHPYSDSDQLAVDIRAIKLEEALADKLKCLIQRRHSFDLFDLVHAIFIDKTIEVNRAEMMQVFLKKTIFERSPGAAKNLLLGVPFDLMKAYWSKLVCPKDSLFGFDQAVQMFSSGLGDLFAGYGAGYGTELAFYPAELRNKIMLAGESRKLLKLRYHGATRLIEPYSLKYKVTKDGTGREYFWGWDRSGGNSRTVGIKAFLNQDVQELELTDESFEPQFEIELAKAGEIHDSLQYGARHARVASILGNPSRTHRVPRVGLSDIKHIFGCPRCGKRYFRTGRFDTMIKPHKRTKYSRYDDCFGGIGHYLGQKR